MTLDSKNLMHWFSAEQRDLPWRIDRTPYTVWVSEMMLQQTQVAVVIPYFLRWMKQFPTVHHLAAAQLDEVIKAWEGLGYYSRARYLYAGACQIVEQFKGIFPDNEKELSQIKGIGPYTVGAIRSFAFHQRAPAVDGNVIRVLARYFLIEDDIVKPKVIQHIREVATDILPENESWIVSEALIELGATICTRKPQCEKCPIRKCCRAYSHGAAARLPYKSTKIKIVPLYRSVALLRWNDHWLVQRGQKGAIMSDLHEYPYLETQKEGISESELANVIEAMFRCRTVCEGTLPEVSHSFTKYNVRLRPVQFRCVDESMPVVDAPYRWYTEEELSKLAFSSGHRRIRLEILERRIQHRAAENAEEKKRKRRRG